MDDYIKSQSKAALVVTSDDLKCKDCRFRDDSQNTAFCLAFVKGESRKPNSVLLGGDCPEYIRR